MQGGPAAGSAGAEPSPVQPHNGPTATESAQCSQEQQSAAATVPESTLSDDHETVQSTNVRHSFSNLALRLLSEEFLPVLKSDNIELPVELRMLMVNRLVEILM